MKTHLFIQLLSLGLMLHSMCADAQTNVCSLLTVTGVSPDTTDPALYQITIQYNGSNTDLIGYPIASAVLDCNGDTVAEGFGFWFGQLGQSSQDYPVNVSGSLTCGPLQVYFTYLDSQGNPQACTLSYTITGEQEKNISESRILVYPNPTSGLVSIESNEHTEAERYLIMNLDGRHLLSGFLSSQRTEIELGSLPDGVYLLRSSNMAAGAKRIVKVSK